MLMNRIASSVEAPDSVLALIGNTPIQALNRITAKLGVQGKLIAKLENLNPGGSMKDRIAVAIIRDALARGDLRPGQPVLEVTSGNTGIGLALVCRAMGHPFYAVMSRAEPRQRPLVDQHPGGMPGRVTGEDMTLVKERAADVREQRGAYFANQFENPANAEAHFQTTGPELWKQCDGKLDAIVAFAGTGGALGGLARYFHHKNPAIRVYAVEPSCAASLASACCFESAHLIQGGGYGKPTLNHVCPADIDGYLQCADEDAVQAARLLAREEGIFGGYSTGAHLHAAIELLRGREAGNIIAFLVCDTGMKYLSTDLYP